MGNSRTTQSHIAKALAFVLLLLVVSGTNGCLNFPLLSHLSDFPNSLAQAVSIYRGSAGHWPSSLEDLHSFEGKVRDEELRKKYSIALSKFPWDQLQGKTAFTAMPDGSLRISLPPLHNSWSDKNGSITWDAGASTITVY
jgi:hypothetical protein